MRWETILSNLSEAEVVIGRGCCRAQEKKHEACVEALMQSDRAVLRIHSSVASSGVKSAIHCAFDHILVSNMKKLATQLHILYRSLQYHNSWSCLCMNHFDILCWHLFVLSTYTSTILCLTQDWAVSKWSPWYTFVQVLKAGATQRPVAVESYWILVVHIRPTHPAGQHYPDPRST